jgi:WD40 repeat protein
MRSQYSVFRHVFLGRSIHSALIAVCVLSFTNAGRCQDHIRYPVLHPYNNVSAVAFTPDSRSLFVANHLGTITVVDVSSGRTVRSFAGPKCLDQVVFCSKGSTLAGICGGLDEGIRFWNVADWKSLPPLLTPDRIPSSIAASSDGKMLAIGFIDQSIILWDMPSREIRYSLHGHIGPPQCLSFSPNGAILASASPTEDRGSPIFLWDARTGYRVRVIIAHPRRTTCVAFLPGGSQLASSGYDGPRGATIKIWDVASGKDLQTLVGHTNSVIAMVPLPRDRLISGGQDCTVRLWDLATSRELRKVSTDGDSVETLVLSPNGKYLACGLISSAGRYKLWKLSDVFPEAAENSVDRPR